MVRPALWFAWALSLAAVPAALAQAVAVAQLSGVVSDESGGQQ
jgi:hypothetical protein